MKQSVIAIIFLLLSASCSRPLRPHQHVTEAFIDEVRLPVTPVSDQGRSALCWAYAMAATIEAERLRTGDSVTLSTDYAARMLLKEEARRYFLSGGRHRISLRGTAPMFLDLMERYGMLPFSSYYNSHGEDIRTAGVNYGTLVRKVEQVTAASATLSEAERLVDELVDCEIGYLPGIIGIFGMNYTPLEFAHSVCTPGDYVSLTSFTHHPFGESFALEIPDNLWDDRFLNLPIDTLMAHIVRAIRHGHPVCWEGDVTEEGFNFRGGSARLAGGHLTTGQAGRQQAFESLRTTDDHCMMLCGLARDRRGRRFFIAKNSWGKRNAYGGFMYLDYDYVKLKTIAVVMSRAAFER